MNIQDIRKMNIQVGKLKIISSSNLFLLPPSRINKSLFVKRAHFGLLEFLGLFSIVELSG